MERARLRMHLQATPPSIPGREKLKGTPTCVPWPPPPGWIRGFLLQGDDLLWGRWDYWLRTQESGGLLGEGIPQIAFAKHPQVEKMMENVLSALQELGRARGEAISYLLDWLLYALGDETSEVEHVRAEERAFRVCYSLFSLDFLQLYPHDYWGDLLSSVQHGRWQGFFPTPMSVVEAMLRMVFHDLEGDVRGKTVNDPCVGTGRMLLYASNHSLRLFGNDINATVLKACRVNLWLYAPWGVAPFRFWSDERCT